MGVPYYWAITLDRQNQLNHVKKIYFAHETRLARMLVEGSMRDRYESLKEVCHPDGHDASFYAYLEQLLNSKKGMISLDQAFPNNNGFSDVFYHVLNHESAKFDRVIAVGELVSKETELIYHSPTKTTHYPNIKLCPNGVTDFKGSLEEIQQANSLLKRFSNHYLGFLPDLIFTSVSRNEISKAPWRNIGLFQSFAENNQGKKKAVLFWLVRPKPLPTQIQVDFWQKNFNWPFIHKSKSYNGDLNYTDLTLWKTIQEFNLQYSGHFHIFYINQFGWEKQKFGKYSQRKPLGNLDLMGTTFRHLRIGTDVELGLSIYEPFGIAPLEPFSSGAICLLSDACGSALFLRNLIQQGLIPNDGVLIGNFTQHNYDPEDIDLSTYFTIEGQAYDHIIPNLNEMLNVQRYDRIKSARKAMLHLSWDSVVRKYFIPSIE
jgi:hypothetical protein